MALSILLNGQNRTFEPLKDPASLNQILAVLGMKPDRVAAEHNGQILPRVTWSEPNIYGEDRLELVHFVGGGAGSIYANVR